MRAAIARGLENTGYAMHITVGPHTLRADEPVDKGGTDSGPTPHEMLLSALAACISMTLRMYATRKGWPLANAHVRVTGGPSADGTGYAVNCRVGLEGPLDAEQRARLIDIAQRCPVHRTLTGHVAIQSAEEAL
jgi:putative redox protein